VIDLQGLMRSGVFAWLANGGLTIGLDESREGAPAFYDLIVRQPRHAHALDCNLAVLPALGVAVDWDFTWLPERPEVASAVRNKWGLDKGRWVILQPGARWVNKRWPAEHFAQLLGLAAAARPDLRFAVLGSAEDQPLAQAIARASSQRCLDLTGKLSLPEMVECIRLSELMVTNDTGPMHVAAALGKPVVALFGPTDPSWTGPYGQLEHVMQLALPCVPCRKSDCTYVKKFECLRGITPEAVFKAVLARLKSSGE
jgi:lipopolysaccharide heptosyltransferase II